MTVGVRIPPEILATSLPLQQKLILAAITQLHDAGGCWASYKHFADWIGCTERQIADNIRRLVAGKYVRKVGRKHLPLPVPKQEESAGNKEESGQSGNGAQLRRKYTSSTKKGTRKRTKQEESGQHTFSVGSKEEDVGNQEDSSCPSELETKHETKQENLNLIAPDKPTRQRDELFDVIADVLGMDPSLGTNGGIIGKVKSGLRDAKPPYTAADVRLFGEMYAAKHPNTLSPKWSDVLKEIGMVRNSRLLELHRNRKPFGQTKNGQQPASRAVSHYEPTEDDLAWSAMTESEREQWRKENQ